jgi:hypothetical protein
VIAGEGSSEDPERIASMLCRALGVRARRPHDRRHRMPALL